MPNDAALENLIKAVQTHLVAKGYKLVVDGDMGEKTYKAIVDRQRPAVPSAQLKPTNLPWRLAFSLETLRTQVNALAPNRNKSGDGTIGDIAHQSRSSDHNAWVRDANNQPVVTAIDITHDPDDGVNCNIIAERVKDDPRVKYVIWNGRIWNLEKGAKWRTYSGANPHRHHIHISVKSDQAHYDNRDPWRLK